MGDYPTTAQRTAATITPQGDSAESPCANSIGLGQYLPRLDQVGLPVAGQPGILSVIPPGTATCVPRKRDPRQLPTDTMQERDGDVLWATLRPQPRGPESVWRLGRTKGVRIGQAEGGAGVDHNLRSTILLLTCGPRAAGDIRYVDVSGLSGLSASFAADNAVEDLSGIECLQGLTWLYLDSNNISDVQPISAHPWHKPTPRMHPRWTGTPGRPPLCTEPRPPGDLDHVRRVRVEDFGGRRTWGAIVAAFLVGGIRGDFRVAT